MSKIKCIIAYTIYGFVLLLAFFFAFSLITTAIQPTFFPNKDISGLKDTVNIISTMLAVVSAILAIYSLYSSTNATRELKQLLKETEGRIITKVTGVENVITYTKNTPKPVEQGNGVDSESE